MAECVKLWVVSGQHSFIGSLENRGLRVMDVMNDRQSDFLELSEVTILRGFEGQKLQELAQATLPKLAIDFVLLSGDKHEAALRRKHAFVEKQSVPAVALLAEYEIHGVLMAKLPFDPKAPLRFDASSFFPLVSPRVVRLGPRQEAISAGVALVNRMRVSALYPDQSPADKPPARISRAKAASSSNSPPANLAASSIQTP